MTARISGRKEKNMEKVKLNNNVKSYEVVNQDGEHIGKFLFNPCDTGIVKRYTEVVKHLCAMRSEVESEDYFSTLINLEEEMKKQMRYLVGNDSSDIFFEVMGAFSMLPSGEFYIEQILTIIGGLIEAEANNRKKLMQKRIEKHTKKYK